MGDAGRLITLCRRGTENCQTICSVTEEMPDGSLPAYSIAIEGVPM
jgi:hypothetical protein